MTFEYLNTDTPCDCLGNALEDNLQLFARKINKPTPKESDFKSHWERGKRPQKETDCEAVCSYKGLSINLCTEQNQEEIIRKFVQTFQIAPKHKDSMMVFRFLSDAGKVKHTPTPKDKSHYDLYKSDTFSLENIEIAQVLVLKEFIQDQLR